MKITRVLNHMTLSQLEVYQNFTDAILEVSNGVFEEILLEVSE